MAVNRDKILRAAEKLVQKGKVEQAIKEYEKLLKANPNDANTINRVGDLYGRVGQVDKAIELYEKIADNFTQDGFATKAIAILKKINRLAPQRLDIFNKLAELYIQQGLLVEAQNQYQIMADWYTKNDEPKNAIEIHQKLIQLDPNNHMAHLRLADLLIQTGEADEAIQVYDRLGTLLLEREKYDEAERLYRHALDNNPPTGDFVAPLISALLDAGRSTTAREFLTEALKLSPDSHELRVKEVKTCLVFGDAAEAKEKAEQILADRPDDIALRSMVGEAMISSGQAGEARDLIVPAAESLIEEGDFTGAQEMIQGLVKAMPQDQIVLEAAVRAYEPMGDKEMAFTLKAALADSKFRAGQHDDARRLYTELNASDPDNKLFEKRIRQLEDGSAIVEDAEEPLPEEPPDIAVPAPVEAAAVEPPQAAAVDFDPRERLAEATVFAKYGLVEKAIGHLEQIVASFPEQMEAREKLVLLYVEKGNLEDAIPAARPLIEHYAETDNAAGLKTLMESLPQLQPEKAGEDAPETADEPVESVEDEEIIVVEIEEEEPAAADFEPEIAAEEPAEEDQEISFEIEDLSAEEEVSEAPVADEEAEIVVDEVAEVAEAEEPDTEVDEIPDILVDEEPDIAVDEAAEIVVDEEPDIAVDEVAEVVVGEEPDIAVDEAAEIVVGEEPDIEVDEVAEIVVGEEPDIEVDEVAEIVVDEESESVVDEEPKVVETEIPDFVVDVEPDIEVDEVSEIEVDEVAEIVEDEAAEIAVVDEPEGVDFEVETTDDAQAREIDFDSQSIEIEAEAEPVVFGTGAGLLEAESDVAELVDEPEQAAPQSRPGPEPTGVFGAALSELDAIEKSVRREPRPSRAEKAPPAPVLEALEPVPVVEVTEESGDTTDDLVEISAGLTGPSISDIEQTDFFIQQELYEDAIRMLGQLEAEHPDDPEVAERRLLLKSKGVLLEDVPVVAEGPEELFADEEEYIDLAKELEAELAEEEAMVEDATGRSKDEADLEEVFKEFQKGVAEQLSEEDSDTHFNLGIAYKEMGLLPEAIREFQVASRDPSFFVECCSMIGVCYVEQGMSEQAAEWYSKALSADDLSTEAKMALTYDLASVLEVAGDMGRAVELYQEIAAASPGFRDVSERIGALSGQ